MRGKQTIFKRWMSVLIILTLWTSSSLLLYAEENLQQSEMGQNEPPALELETDAAAEYISGEVLVFYENGQMTEDAVKTVSQENDDRLTETVLTTDNMAVSVVELSQGRSVEDAVEDYTSYPLIDLAIPNYILDTCEEEIENTEIGVQGGVNDTDYAPYQWYLEQVRAKGAWDILSQVPHEPIKVAVLDTGADISHPDLVNVINHGESGEVLSDALDSELGPLQGDGYALGGVTGASGDTTHGTHVTGILGAEANNGVGIAGTASSYDNSVMDLMVIDVFPDSETTFSYLFKGMDYAKSQGAKIINLSLGINLNLNAANTKALIEGTQKVFDAFMNEGIIVVCAAGNSDNGDGVPDNGNITSLPGDLSSTISVINVDRTNQKNVTSNYGSLKDVSAPGTDIWSTKNKGSYGSASGTSMSAPIVTGIAAMMLSVNPNLSFTEIREILCNTSTDLYSSGFDIYSGYGLVNAEAAVKEAALRAGKWAESSASISYKTHVQTYGWQDWKADGQTSGTQGQAKRLEAIQIKLNNPEVSGGVEYKTHVQTYGWQSWKANGEMSGTQGQAKRLEAIQIRLTGQMAEKYDIYYRVHVQTYGWLDWAKNGESAGSSSYAKRLEGIEIKLVKKGGQAPGSTGNAYIHPLVKYQTHVQTYGWQGYVQDGAVSGTVGKAKRLEGIHISLLEPQYSGNIQYITHVQTYGWEKSWKSNGEMSGTQGQAKRLEAIRIQLTGEMAEKYDIYYQVHIQTYGWMGWARNGGNAGSAGMAKRLEGIRIVLVPKGGNPPGSMQNAYYEK